MRWTHTLGDILSTNERIINALPINAHQKKHFAQMAKCHTDYYGGYVMDCNDCGHQQYRYHSCRNRHCPSCQASKREEWIARQHKYLLDVPYFHVVFTLPEELNTLCLFKPRQMYNLLFETSWQTISTFAGDAKYLGAKSGMTAVLHTWSQNLNLHPHLHCIVPGGGISKNGKWKNTRSKGKYLFPGKAMAMVYKAIFLNKLKESIKKESLCISPSFVDELYHKRWVVYAKRPFASPHHVIEYLGRYTHKIAISNYRIINVDDQHVTFQYKDYRHAAKKKTMKLTIKEFIRRISMHILPHKYVRIRHYGILSYHGRSKIIPKLQSAQGYQPIVQNTTRVITLPYCKNCQSLDLDIVELKPKNNRSP